MFRVTLEIYVAEVISEHSKLLYVLGRVIFVPEYF